MKVFIVGGVAGGVSCAARLRRPDERTEIIMVERGPDVSYSSFLKKKVGPFLDFSAGRLPPLVEVSRTGSFEADAAGECWLGHKTTLTVHKTKDKGVSL
jgi:hypothetical protein